MDRLLELISNLANVLIPILSFVILVFIIIILNQLRKILIVSMKRIEQLEDTIKLANESMEKIQTPLETVSKVALTLDKMHQKSKASAYKTKQTITDNIDKLKNGTKSLITKTKLSLLKIKHKIKGECNG